MLRRRLVSVTLLILTLSACGFHLRGSIPLPSTMNNLYISAAKGSFKNKLEQVLENAGATVSSSEAGIDAKIKITEYEVSNEVGTLDERGKANSYTLILKVVYKLKDSNGVVHRESTLVERRRYDFDPARVIESESEERDLRLDMEQDIALRIVRQLSAMVDYPILKKPIKDKSDPEQVSDIQKKQKK